MGSKKLEDCGGGLKISGLGGYQFGGRAKGGLLLLGKSIVLGEGVSTPLHAMLS